MIVEPSQYKLSSHAPFIAFEGINGCGKTTLIRNLASHLTATNISHIITREPGGSPLGTEIRKLLLEWDGAEKSVRSELLLFAADRAEHIEKVIAPAQQADKWVLCDRFIYSTIAFQGYGRGLSRSLIDQANELAIGNTLPNVVVLLDIDPRIAAQRMASRTDNGQDNFEREALAFHTRIRNGFLELAETSPTPFLVLNAERSPEELASTLITAFDV